MSSELAVDIAGWVDRARADPVRHLERMATEIVMTAIGRASGLRDDIYLKGGILMGLAYGSPRGTADLDYTAIAEPDPANVTRIRADLETSLRATPSLIGYPDIECRIQSFEHRPRAEGFGGFTAPALIVGIGYARRDTPQFRHLTKLQCPDVVRVDISFREPVSTPDTIRLVQSGVAIKAYALIDIIAEKLRAFLQQEARNRSRRQDIYDLAHLIERFAFDETELRAIHDLLHAKCRARNIAPSVESIDDPKLKARAKAEWRTMEIEIGTVPDFDERHGIVRGFYRRLPWAEV
jgi:hypothetical protein